MSPMTAPHRQNQTVTLQQVETALKCRAERWAGRCYEISSAIVRAKLVRGVAVYGDYIGTIHPKSMFVRKPIVHHGWVALAGGGVLDPTRWVFESAPPYLYWSSTCGPEYDEGSNVRRAESVTSPPQCHDPEQLFRFGDKLPAASWRWLRDTMQLDDSNQPRWTLTENQVLWIGHLPIDMLGPHARHLYQAIDKVGLKAFVPKDNWLRVTSGRWDAQMTGGKL